MGAGFVFSDLNNEDHHGSCHCSVGGDLSSLRAEAVALDILLDHTSAHASLVFMTDSLSLMQTLESWDWADFFPIPHLQKHCDVIEQLSAKIRARDGVTVLVKVKSHLGVPLNEAADVEADKGCESKDV